MGDPNLIRTLRYKANELQRYKANELQRLITSYEEAAERTRRDLATITSALTIFQKEDDTPNQFVPHAQLRGLFQRDEAWSICLRALRAEPNGLTTRQFAILCLEAKDYDHTNAILRRAMVQNLTSILAKNGRRHLIVRAGRIQGCAAWQLP